MKFISAARNEPQPITIGPIENVAVFQAPPGMKGVIIGIITSLTKDCINVVAATPITNATANPSTLYSLRKSMNSDKIPI